MFLISFPDPCAEWLRIVVACLRRVYITIITRASTVEKRNTHELRPHNVGKQFKFFHREIIFWASFRVASLKSKVMPALICARLSIGSHRLAVEVGKQKIRYQRLIRNGSDIGRPTTIPNDFIKP